MQYYTNVAPWRVRYPTISPEVNISTRARGLKARGATTFSKLGVQFLGLGYCTEQNKDGIPSFVHCSLLRNSNHILHQKSWGGPSKFWGSIPLCPPSGCALAKSLYFLLRDTYCKVEYRTNHHCRLQFTSSCDQLQRYRDLMMLESYFRLLTGNKNKYPEISRRVSK